MVVLDKIVKITAPRLANKMIMPKIHQILVLFIMPEIMSEKVPKIPLINNPSEIGTIKMPINKL